ncbi:M23 family metallopeptidase [Rhodoferax mekongensis]|uniref:M23 family metallopeptidase n=1 Tax=Rhodoferax mekongensis TaxID=3068341 RepID=UPI0028BDF18E|nr:M23 family metallopeptidase [Rhodoferax sp. TBRC 17199]MDT7514389.1 M23 family metallopeptidase [Rhodoferax sp. TBRC 17199]
MKHGLNQAVEQCVARAAALVQQYPKRITAIIAALLVGGTGATFAVANFAPDASDLPVRTVVETVQSDLLAARNEDITELAMRLYRSETTRSSDTADTLLKRLGVIDPQAAAYLRADAQAQSALLGRAGRNVTAEVNERQGLLKLSARWSPVDDGTFKRLTIEKTVSGFRSQVETLPLVANTRLASGVINSSLFAATDDARLPDSIATQVAEIFSGDIDFHRALRKGDRFSVVYETLEGDGEPMRAGRVLSAEFVNAGKPFQAMWFKDPVAPGKGGYYTLAGESLRRAFLASPLEFSRVTSGFKMRFHPILQTWRAHLGVDYAAATGTPVRSVGDGTVDFAGVQGGFGNVVMVKHRNNQTTVYAHLSRIHVKKGQSVSQGQNIGAVGATGWATGPHLHFEFRVNGVHHDPLTIARQSEAVPVSTAAKPLFDKAAQSVRAQLASAAQLTPGSAE